MEKKQNKQGAHSKRGHGHLRLAYGKTVFEPETQLSEKSVIMKTMHKEMDLPNCKEKKVLNLPCPEFLTASIDYCW